MARSVGTLLILCFLHISSSHPLSHPTNWLRQCRASTNLSITTLEVLPGGGWDNLRNIDMGRVMNFDYSECQTTEDGLYFIPDEVFVIPQKETGLETNSEIISSWMEQKSSTSSTINADISFLDVLNGKFSVENQRMKTHQVKDDSTTARVQVRNFIYTVKANPDFTLDSRFAQQAIGIADAIENNQTKWAKYLSEKMVVDYGTHVITSVDAGAALVQEDYLSSTYVSDSVSQSSSITATAGLNFFDKLKFDISSQNTQQSSALQTYQSNIHYSLVKSHGGVPFYPGITLQTWQENIKNNLVAIDRSGLPLHYIINTNTFPDLPQPTVEKVALSVRKAINRYFSVNKRPGCVKIDSQNFNFQANFDDNSCEGPATNISFGGIYQRCDNVIHGESLCETLAQKNPLTGDYSCPPPYLPTLLRSEVRHQTYNEYSCHTETYSCGFLGLWECEHQVCQNYYYVGEAHVNTYWCAINGVAPENSGYLFGGFYGPSLQNPLTKVQNCPPNFIPVKFLSDGLMICLSNDYELGPRHSVDFGGLFSCESVNPLSGGQRRCPPKYSQHLVTVSDGCEILYCVQSGLFTGGELLPIRLPPFTRPPLISRLPTNTVMVMTEANKNWVRTGNAKMWKAASLEEINAMAKAVDPQSSQMSGGAKTGLAFGVIGLVILVAVGVMLKVKRSRGGVSVFRRGRSYEEIVGEAGSDGTEQRQEDRNTP